MKQAAVAGFAAGLAMMIGGALGAVSHGNTKPALDGGNEVMEPMIGGQAMLPDRDIMDNVASSPLHTALAAAMKETGVASALKARQAGSSPCSPRRTTPWPRPGTSPKSTLARRMSYLIVPGKYNSQALLQRSRKRAAKHACAPPRAAC